MFVLAQASANAAILAEADQTNGSGWFNGDDAVLLRKGTVVIDSIGQRGSDPGTEWGTALTSTADNTLRRKAAVEAGDTIDSDAFDPALEWDGFTTDTFDGLGCAGSSSCAPPPPPPPPFGVCGDGTETSIHDIQGSAPASPLAGSIRVIEGVVVGDFQGASGLNGYFLQEEDAEADTDAQTSEGIFVFHPSAPAFALGDAVRVRGTVFEFNGLTELTTVDTTAVCSTGNAVAAAAARRPAGVVPDELRAVRGDAHDLLADADCDRDVHPRPLRRGRALGRRAPLHAHTGRGARSAGERAPGSQQPKPDPARRRLQRSEPLGRAVPGGRQHTPDRRHDRSVLSAARYGTTEGF